MNKEKKYTNYFRNDKNIILILPVIFLFMDVNTSMTECYTICSIAFFHSVVLITPHYQFNYLEVQMYLTLPGVSIMLSDGQQT